MRGQLLVLGPLAGKAVRVRGSRQRTPDMNVVCRRGHVAGERSPLLSRSVVGHSTEVVGCCLRRARRMQSGEAERTRRLVRFFASVLIIT